jgi:hypothetical protein
LDGIHLVDHRKHHTLFYGAVTHSVETFMYVSQILNNAVLGVIGFILSAYSVYVEHKVEHKDDSPDGDEFKALCDIESIGASCRYEILTMVVWIERSSLV